jgi:hypothetical protein
MYVHRYVCLAGQSVCVNQLVAEDLMEDGTVSRISNAYSLRRGRRQPPTYNVEELQFVIET